MKNTRRRNGKNWRVSNSWLRYGTPFCMHVCVTRWAPSSSKADVPLCYFPSQGLETLLCWRAKTSIRITFAQESFPLNTPVCGGIPGFLDQRVHRNMNILLFSFSQPENVLSNLSDPPIFKYLEQIFFAVQVLFYYSIKKFNSYSEILYVLSIQIYLSL